MAESRPRVVVLGSGGTIAMVPTANGGVAPALSASELVAAVPGLAQLDVDLNVEDFRRMPGASLTFEDLTELAVTIRERLDTGGDAVVVTQGTDTIEESAYLIDLLHSGPEPVVVTGAMRNPTQAGADGPGNILAAIQVAANAEARHRGCLVVLADQIHAARHVRKAHSTSLTAFQSPNNGPLGHVVEGQPRFAQPPAHRNCIPPAELARAGEPPRVVLVTVTLGDDGTLLNAIPGHCDGVVIAALGAGHVPDRLVDHLTRLATGVPVVLATRTGAGPVLSSTYSFNGSETELLRAGLISAGFLHPFKARVLLHSLLRTGADRATIAAAFGAAGGYAPAAQWPWPPLGPTRTLKDA